MRDEIPPVQNSIIDDSVEDTLEMLAVLIERADGGTFVYNIFRRAFQELKSSRELAERLKNEIKLLNEGYAKCQLCGRYDIPVNRHNDCAGCARDQYGDE